MSNNIESKVLNINSTNGNKKGVVNGYGSLSLAYIGDAVFEIFARTKVVKEKPSNVNKMNSMTRQYVRATSQAKMYEKALEIITEEELAVMKRGRNVKSHTSAKNASIAEYRHATGLEALFGYLYLIGEVERLEYIFNYIIQYDEQNN